MTKENVVIHEYIALNIAQDDLRPSFGLQIIIFIYIITLIYYTISFQCFSFNFGWHFFYLWSKFSFFQLLMQHMVIIRFSSDPLIRIYMKICNATFKFQKVYIPNAFTLRVFDWITVSHYFLGFLVDYCLPIWPVGHGMNI